MVRYSILFVAVFICNFCVNYQFLGAIIHHFYCVIEFNTVEPLDVNEFSDFCDELVGPFGSHFFIPM